MKKLIVSVLALMLCLTPVLVKQKINNALSPVTLIYSIILKLFNSY
jgi:hypothetical protein